VSKLFAVVAGSVAALSFAPSAYATDYVCGVDSQCDFTEADTTGLFSYKVDALASFDDYFQFTLGGAYEIALTMTATPSTLTFSALELLASDKLTSLGTFLPNGEITPLVTTVDAGTYYVHVAGASSATKKVTYAGTIDVSPVPEASTWAMMILGLGLVGAAARRRSDVTTSVSFA